MADRWTITVQAEGGTVPTVVRVRKLLKMALRAYGLRAVAVAEENATDAATGKPEAKGADHA